MLPPRTSPTANTPGRLVSSRCGGRGERPARRRQIVRRQIRPGLDEALARRARRSPRASACSGTAPVITKTWRMSRVSMSPVCVVPPAHALEVVVALERDDLGVACAARSPDSPRCAGSDSATCVSASPPRADEHVHAPRRLRQEHRRLAGGVAAADDDHLFAAAQLRLDEGRAVVDAGAFELRQVRRAASLRYSAPVAMMTVRAGTRGPSSISIAYGLPVAGEPARALRDHELRRRTSAPACRRAPASSWPEMPVGKAEIVLDPRARARLAARRVRLEHQHVEPFRRAVDRRRQPRRPGADDRPGRARASGRSRR